MRETGNFRRFLDRLNPSTTSLRVSMLGPSGVGKTSMLATMYDQMERVVSNSDLQLTPNIEDAAELSEKVTALQRLFATDGLKPIMSEGIVGTADWRSFDFAVGRRGRKPTLKLEFVDYPGGWIENQADSKQRDWVVGLLRESDAILIPIDAPALMERKALWHGQRNRPDFVYNLIQMAFEELPSPRLVILAPIRCERYVQSAMGQDALRTQVIAGYEKLLSHLAFGRFQDLVTVVVTPIQTLGGIHFHGSPQNEYLPVFRKLQPDSRYSPADTEQPFRYVMRFALSLHSDHRQTGYFQMIRQLFRGDAELINASTQFAAGSKDGVDGFAVLQGERWLSMRGPN